MKPEEIKKKNNVLNEKFMELCEKGNLNDAKELYEKYYLAHITPLNKFLSFLRIAPKTVYMLDPHFEEDQALLTASDNKHYEIVKFLLKDSNFFNQYDNIDNAQKTWRLGRVLGNALEGNNLEITELVLPLINNKKDSFYQTIDTSFCRACEKGYLDVIKSFFKDREIKNQKLELFEDEHNTKSSHSLILNGFIDACQKGQLDVVKFFTSGELNYKIDFSKFRKNQEIEVRDSRIMEYLICEFNLDKKYYGMPIIYRDREKKIFECDEYVNNLFEKRDLYKEIKSEINEQKDNRVTPKKLKV